MVKAGQTDFDTDPELLKLKARENFLVLETREKWAAAEIESFLADNPGTNVVMVYGREHGFGADRFSDSPPRVEDVNWPKAYEYSTANGTASLNFQIMQLKDKPAEQAALIERTPIIEPGTFRHVSSERGQLLAIEKLSQTPGFGGNTPEELDMAIFNLRFNAVNDQVRREIEKVRTRISDQRAAGQ